MNKKLNLRFIPAFLVLFSCISSAQPQQTTTPKSGTGVEGVITVSPIRPGPIKRGSEIPTWGPFANTTFAVQNKNGMVASFTTDDQGRFRLWLAPGHYTVAPKEPKSGPGHYGPFDVDVVAGRMTHVEWRCDSGMR
jgi:hypothetical protein